MKNTSTQLTLSIFAAALLGLAAHQASALTVPVAQDSSSSSSGKLPATNGKAATLALNPKQTTLLRFNLNDLDVVPSAFQPGNIKSATLRLYIVSAKTAGNVTVHNITSDWQERFDGTPVQLPSISNVTLATIASSEIVSKNFVNVDVTNAVISALANGNSFGFALQTTDATAKIVVASKEGPATGYSAELEIEANTATDGSGNFTAALNALTVANSFTIDAHPNSTGAGNSFLGGGAGSANTSGANNIFLGNNAGNKNIGGSENSFIGSGAGMANTSGQGNTFLGYLAGIYSKSGSGNTFVGHLTGQGTVLESNNTFLGDNAGASAGVNDSTAIGHSALATISNAVILGTDTSKVGIHTSAPNSSLQVSGSLSLQVRLVTSTLLASLGDTDYALVVTGNSATAVVLPNTGVAGRVYVVKNRGTQPITLGFISGPSTIDGAASLSIPVNGVAQVICDGTNWEKIN